MTKFRVLAIASALALPLSVLAQTSGTAPVATPGMSTTPSADSGKMAKDKPAKNPTKKAKGNTTPAPAPPPDATKAPSSR